jgi:two-component sensor histidine kinase/ligand-binding sensor domain-containing protein
MSQSMKNSIYIRRVAVLGLLGFVFVLSAALGLIPKWRAFLLPEKTERAVLKIQPLDTRSSKLSPNYNFLKPEIFSVETRDFFLNGNRGVTRQQLVLKENRLVNPKPVEFPELSRKDTHLENIRYSDKAHGFFSNSISTIEEDRDGYLWFGSELDGLCKSNGFKAWIFKKENGLKSNTVKHVFADSRSRIWLCWDLGVSYIENSKIYHVSNKIFEKTHVVRIRENKNKELWFCTQNSGLIKLDKNGLEVYGKSEGLPGNEVNDIAFSQDGTLYIAAAKEGLLTLKGAKGKQYLDKDQIGIQFAPISICKDNKRIWMGSYYGSQYFFEQGKLFQFKLHGKYERSFRILKNDKGIWYSDYGFGVHLIRKDGKIKSYGMADGLTDRNAFDIAFDHNSNIWVADPFSGISMLRISPFSVKPWKVGYPTRFHRENDSTVWITSNGSGVFRLIGSMLTNYNAIPDKQGLTLHHSWDAMVDENGDLWSSSHGLGIAQITKNKMIYYSFSKGNVINDLTKDGSGVFWFSTNEGLRIYDPETKLFRLLTKHDGLLSNSIQSTTIDKSERMWICTDFGVNILQKGQIGSLTVKDGLCSNNIHQAFEDQSGSIWLLSNDQGVSVIKGDRVDNITTLNGLISNEVQGIVQDTQGLIWISSESGVSRIEPKANRKYEIENFDFRYGGFMYDFTKAALSCNDGRLLFGTTKGIVEFDPYMTSLPEGQAKLKIEKLVLDNTPVDITSKKEIKVLRNQRLTCEVSLLHWGLNEDIGLSYTLKKKGDRNKSVWNSVEHGRPFLIDTRSNSGRYDIYFRIDSDASRYEMKYGSIVIRTVWYDSGWFYLLLILALTGAFYIFLKLRLSYLNSRKVELENIVLTRTDELKKEKEELAKANEIIEDKIREKDTLIYEMHHRVKNNLQTISSLLDLQLSSLKDEVGIRVLKDAVRRISAMSTSHELLYSSHEDLSEVDLSKFIKDLMQYQKSIILDSRDDSFIFYDLEPVTVSVSDAISVGMIISECISNSVKHAFVGQKDPKINVSLKMSDEKIHLKIEDNGSGWPKNRQDSEKLGFRLVRIFTKKIGGSLELESDANGTVVSILFNSSIK